MVVGGRSSGRGGGGSAGGQGGFKLRLGTWPGLGQWSGRSR